MTTRQVRISVRTARTWCGAARPLALAETGDPHRFATARALVKHAGLAPRKKLSGSFTGRTKLTGQGGRNHG